MSMQSKLVSIAIGAILIICFLSVKIIHNSYYNYKNSADIEKMIEQVDSISTLVHELQIERGLSAAYLISSSYHFKNKLQKQRLLVNKELSKFNDIFIKNINSYDEKIKQRIRKIINNFNTELKSKRQSISDKSTEVFNIINFFTSMNNELLSNIIYLSKMSNNQEVTSEIIAFENLQLLKDQVGLERALGSIILLWNSSSEAAFMFKNIARTNMVYKENFYLYTSDKNKELYNKAVKDSDLFYVDELINKFITWNMEDKIDINAVYWFESISKKIDFMHEQSDFFIKNLKAKVISYKDRSYNELISLVLLMVISILLFSIITYIIQDRIIKSLSNFKIGLLSFFEYLNHNSDEIKLLDDSSKDEFGIMSKIVNQNIIKTKKELDEDKAILNEAILIVKEFEKGNLHQRLIVNVSNPILSNLKNILNKMANNLDITIEELEHTNEEYSASLESLKNTQKQLIESEKMASLGGLVAGVAHEINTPVGIGITGSTHFLELTKELNDKYNNEDMSEDDFKNYLTNALELSSLININLSKAANLVKSFKQIAVDQTSEEKRTFDLSEYLDEVILSIHNIVKKTNLEIEIVCDENIRIKSYPGLISQILTNLIINSIIHAYDEGEKGKLYIKADVNEDNLSLVYKDDGKGISSENLQKIFDPFFTTNRENGGSGLGLNIIYNIITKQLNGKIECESLEGEGVQFNIIFKI